MRLILGREGGNFGWVRLFYNYTVRACEPPRLKAISFKVHRFLIDVIKGTRPLAYLPWLLIHTSPSPYYKSNNSAQPYRTKDFEVRQ